MATSKKHYLVRRVLIRDPERDESYFVGPNVLVTDEIAKMIDDPACFGEEPKATFIEIVGAGGEVTGTKGKAPADDNED